MMDLSSEKGRLLRRDSEWAKAARGGRGVEHIHSYWTEDAVVIPPGLPPVVGKEALRLYLEDSLRMPASRITWEAIDATLSPDGRLA